jgi:hypothetical protein
MLTALATTLNRSPTSSIHRLGRGLPGYLILFAPHAFVHQRQLPTRNLPSPLVFFPISTHSTATPEIPVSSSALEACSIEGISLVEQEALTPDLHTRLRTLYTQ